MDRAGPVSRKEALDGSTGGDGYSYIATMFSTLRGRVSLKGKYTLKLRVGRMLSQELMASELPQLLRG